MVPSATQSTNQVQSRRIWECLNAEDLITFGTPEDLIGLDDVVAVSFWEAKTPNATPGQACQTTTLQSLTPDRIEKWIKMPTGTLGSNGEMLRGKVLVGNQIVAGDTLRPPDDAGGIRLSRSVLGSCFKLPPAAIARISRQSRWYLEFSGYACKPSAFCEGLGTSTFSFAMSADQSQGSVFAILIFHPSIRQEAREQFMDDLQALVHLAGEPVFLPYLVINLCVRISSALVQRYDQQALEIDLHLQRFAAQRHVNSIFGETHARAGSVGKIHQDALNTLKMAKKWARLVMQKPKGISAIQWSVLAVQKGELGDGLDYCIQVLQKLINDAGQSREETTRQLTTALSMLAYEQQKLSRQDQVTSIAIAEASKVIAEETKKDGYSMKTLAVVTMLFLPATSVSSILAMPLFHWNRGDERDVVDGRLWVYFVLAIPLTALTVGLWWIWQRRMSLTTNKQTSKC